MSAEYGWLIERTRAGAGGRPTWWAPGQRRSDCSDDWSTDSLEAVRFARKQDAEKVLREIVRMHECLVIEHGWG